MFQDIGVSKTLIPEYEKYCQQHKVTNTGIEKERKKEKRNRNNV